MGTAILLAATLVGVDFGWYHDDAGKFVYVVQVDPEQLQSLSPGEDLASTLPPDLPRPDRIVIRVGREALPRIADRRSASASANAARSPVVPAGLVHNVGGTSGAPLTETDWTTRDPITTSQPAPAGTSSGPTPTGGYDWRTAAANGQTPITTEPADLGRKFVDSLSQIGDRAEQDAVEIRDSLGQYGEQLGRAGGQYAADQVQALGNRAAEAVGWSGVPSTDPTTAGPAATGAAVAPTGPSPVPSLLPSAGGPAASMMTQPAPGSAPTVGPSGGYAGGPATGYGTPSGSDNFSAAPYRDAGPTASWESVPLSSGGTSSATAADSATARAAPTNSAAPVQPFRYGDTTFPGGRPMTTDPSRAPNTPPAAATTSPADPAGGGLTGPAPGGYQPAPSASGPAYGPGTGNVGPTNSGAGGGWEGGNASSAGPASPGGSTWNGSAAAASPPAATSTGRDAPYAYPGFAGPTDGSGSRIVGPPGSAAPSPPAAAGSGSSTDPRSYPSGTAGPGNPGPPSWEAASPTAPGGGDGSASAGRGPAPTGELGSTGLGSTRPAGPLGSLGSGGTVSASPSQTRAGGVEAPPLLSDDGLGDFPPRRPDPLDPVGTPSLDDRPATDGRGVDSGPRSPWDRSPSDATAGGTTGSGRGVLAPALTDDVGDEPSIGIPSATFDPNGLGLGGVGNAQGPLFGTGAVRPVDLADGEPALPTVQPPSMIGDGFGDMPQAESEPVASTVAQTSYAVVSTLGLLGSLGLNAYMGLVVRGIYRRYRHLVRDRRLAAIGT